MPRPLDIDRAAWFLIRCYGDECAKVAFDRSRRCACRGDTAGVEEWKRVVNKVVELHFARPRGGLH